MPEVRKFVQLVPFLNPPQEPYSSSAGRIPCRLQIALRLAHGPAETNGHLMANTNRNIFRCSDDGSTGKDETDTIKSAQQPGRPGMIVVSRMPNGNDFMSYEI